MRVDIGEAENRFDPVRKSIRGDNMTEKGKISNGVDGGLGGHYTVLLNITRISGYLWSEKWTKVRLSLRV